VTYVTNVKCVILLSVTHHTQRNFIGHLGRFLPKIVNDRVDPITGSDELGFPLISLQHCNYVPKAGKVPQGCIPFLYQLNVH
jgi:hypothetical protein